MHSLVFSDKLRSRHAFTTRLGGVSGGIYESFNLSQSREDDRENVRENYRLLSERLGIDCSRPVFARQIHTDNVQLVTEADTRELFSPAPFEADALVTNRMGVPLIIYIADCVPVLLEDVKAGVVAAVHCGWRSSVMDILGKTVAKMRELGAKPENMSAAIGAAIGPCCFETGGEVPEAVEAWLGQSFSVPGAPGKFMVDLKAANRHRLITLGVRAENIGVSGECTKCNGDKYWSHRITGFERGSQAAVIVLT